MAGASEADCKKQTGLGEVNASLEQLMAVHINAFASYSHDSNDCGKTYDSVKASPQSRPALVCIAGEVAEVSSTTTAIKPGSEVVAYTTPLVSDGDPTSPQVERVPASRVFEKPKSISLRDATDLAFAYLTASAILQQELGIPMVMSLADRTTTSAYSGKHILVIGGQTPLGVALTQVLHLFEPECKIIVTAAIEDQYQLLQRSVHLVSLGSRYAIDGLTPDLMEHLVDPADVNKGWDAILDAGGEVACRGEILDHLIGPQKHVKCADKDMSIIASALLIDRPEIICQFGELLKKAAEAFEIVTEPSCPLVDE